MSAQKYQKYIENWNKAKQIKDALTKKGYCEKDIKSLRYQSLIDRVAYILRDDYRVNYLLISKILYIELHDKGWT